MDKNYIKKIMGIMFPLFTTVLAYMSIKIATGEGDGFYLFMGILVISSWYVGYLLLDQCRHCKWNIILHFDWAIGVSIIRASRTELILLLPFIITEFELKESNINCFTIKNSLW